MSVFLLPLPFFPLSLITAVSLRAKHGRNELPTTAWRLQIFIKRRTEEKTEKGEGGPTTIPRSSFTNYPEYLLTGRLSQCLPSHPTPLIFPLQHPITSHPAPILPAFTARCGEEAPRTSRRTEETRGKKKESEEEEKTEESRALIWETVKSDKTDDGELSRVKLRSRGGSCAPLSQD